MKKFSWETNYRFRPEEKQNVFYIIFFIYVFIYIYTRKALGTDQRAVEDSVKEDADSYMIKSSSLGQSAITIPGLHPGQQYDFSKNEDNSLYSDWNQVVPQAPGNMLSETRGPRGWYTIKVTVKEANSYGVTANNLSAFFKSNGTDLSSLLKSFVPSGSK